MRSPLDNPRFQAFAERAALPQPTTIRPGEGQRFMSMEEAEVVETVATPTNMRVAQVGFDPITGMCRNAQQPNNAASRKKVMNLLLNGIRRSGSMARTASFHGLGALDCSTFNASAMSAAQVDAMTGLALSVIGRADAFTHMNDARSQCWVQHLNAISVKNVGEISPLASQVADALVAEGVLSSEVAARSTTLPFISAVLIAGHVSSVKRAVKLAKCGAEITAANGWAQYETLWAESACMQSWYENPWYLGGGAAVIIGAVWFATRKKKAG